MDENLSIDEVRGKRSVKGWLFKTKALTWQYSNETAISPRGSGNQKPIKKDRLSRHHATAKILRRKTIQNT